MEIGYSFVGAGNDLVPRHRLLSPRLGEGNYPRAEGKKAGRGARYGEGAIVGPIFQVWGTETEGALSNGRPAAQLIRGRRMNGSQEPRVGFSSR